MYFFVKMYNNMILCNISSSSNLSRQYQVTVTLMFTDTGNWKRLLERKVDEEPWSRG